MLQSDSPSQIFTSHSCNFEANLADLASRDECGNHLDKDVDLVTSQREDAQNVTGKSLFSELRLQLPSIIDQRRLWRRQMDNKWESVQDEAVA